MLKAADVAPEMASQKAKFAYGIIQTAAAGIRAFVLTLW
jgi:hypothetical protein